MSINATLIGQIVFVLAIIMIVSTLKFAKGKADNLALVGLYALLLNFTMPPVGWLYCGYWANKKG
ncbi:hypothetical protein TUM4644_16620 [Shewanella colwelliana]|uniref:Cardiolipin synthase N-terminal domain-containing protein n=1 Tax=Shewanella colwelliana TaxID=23 RepID=A0A1E5IZ09_SHECO|nr:hypothetical protein [Shewanella colwelliana]MDX1281223.1 hypothetical protein [Shewanella colwelliana]OEG75388.1 hypothetical protein BEL05_07180 [Shewanella colwelliana]GIU23301.1 hypothetical protein TUM4644_16620 [Shewanella colwelliana]GIU36026.1 hypothetical protein TUM3794_04540 [Shewanella colwelliana]